MYYLQVEADFASAHQLRGYQGKCENLHGHNWRVLVRIKGAVLDPIGMLMDFGALKKLLKSHLDRLDHCFLNETAPFEHINPTSENLSKHLFEEMARELPPGIFMHEVTVWESEKCAATFRVAGE